MEIYIDELSKEIPHELDQQLTFQETIASGAFGTVMRAIETSTNREVAVKVVNKSGAKSALLQKLKQEVSILKQLKHENIVEFFGYIETNTKLYIMMELIKCGTLKHWIQTHKGAITEEEASTITNHLLSAVSYLHSRDICHRDIKPENVMFNNYNDLTSLKLIDFGLSEQHFDHLEESDYCGTMLYMAPEQIEKKTYSKTVDIWAIGVIMFMMLNKGKHPFYNKGDKRRSYIKKIKNLKVKLFNKCSQMASMLLFKLLEPNPSWRYTADKAYRHPWITRRLDDEIPETFNETLKKRNIEKKLKELMMISIFLNKATLKKPSPKVYLIKRDYVNTVDEYSIKQRQRLKRLKEKSFDVIMSDDSIDSHNELRDKCSEFKSRGNSKHVTSESIKSVKAKAPMTNYFKLAMKKNIVLKSNLFHLHKDKMKNGNAMILKLPMITKPINKKNTSDIVKTKSNSKVIPISPSLNYYPKIQANKSTESNSQPSSTKQVTIPKPKIVSKHFPIEREKTTKESSPIKTQGDKTTHNHSISNKNISYPTRNVGRSEPKDKIMLNKLTLSTTSPRKGGLYPKHQNIISEMGICQTDENIRIVPLILPNISIDRGRRCKVGY